jgi:tetratricopeptide (TPR) repeat protein
VDDLFQKIIVDGWKFIQDKPDIVQAITSIVPIIGAAGAAISAFLKWGLPQISRLWKRRVLQKRLTDLFPFEVIKPPERENDVQKLEVLRCLLGSLEPVDYPLADFNIPYKHRDPKIDVLHELERCFNQSNWVLILGRSGLGKTREAAEFALQLHSQGWTILRMTMEGKWLDIPLRFPSDRVPHQRLLFFLDNLNQPMYASRVREGRTQDGLSDDLLRQPLQERLLEYLKFFELECGAEQVRVIATVRNERMPKELGESTSLDMLELEKYKNFWNRFTRYELPDLAPVVIVKMLQGAVEREIVKAQPEDFNEMARCNDGTFRNLVMNLREARTGKKLLTRQNYQETLTGSWEDMFCKVMKRYSFALSVYNAIDLLRKLDIDLNVIEDVTLQKWLLCETSKLFVKGRWKRWKVTWTVPRVIKMVPQLLNPPDGMIEAKKVHLEAIDYLQSISQLLLKQAKKRPEELIQALYGFSFSAFFLERDQEAAKGFRELLRLLEVLETQIQALEIQTQNLVTRLALQDFQSQILMALGTAEAGIGQEAKKIHQIDLAELQFKAAISIYNKALDLKPDDYVAWNEYGAIWGDLNNYEAAIKS